MPAFLIPLPHWNHHAAAATHGNRLAAQLQDGAALQIDGITLQRKAEFHLTLANSALVTALQCVLPGDALAWLQAQWAAGDTRIMPTGRYCLLHKHPDRAPYSAGSWSLVERVIVPGQEVFLRRVERRLGRQLPRPPMHVTTHVAGRPRGIGLPRPALLRRYMRAAAGRTMPPG